MTELAEVFANQPSNEAVIQAETENCPHYVAACQGLRSFLDSDFDEIERIPDSETRLRCYIAVAKGGAIAYQHLVAIRLRAEDEARKALGTRARSPRRAVGAP